jgi:hypothetical protein
MAIPSERSLGWESTAQLKIQLQLEKIIKKNARVPEGHTVTLRTARQFLRALSFSVCVRFHFLYFFYSIYC